MQFHLDGFRPGDPAIAPAADDTGVQYDSVDVLIIGCGPAGLTLATQLSAFPDVLTRIVDQKPGPLTVGQADGIACRTMEMFEAFGFSERVEKEAYWVNETTFWRPAAPGGGIARADRIQDVEDDLSEFPHTILNQARVHDLYLETMRASPRRLEPDYDHRLVDIALSADPTFPVLATFECGDEAARQTTIRARYAVGCDGARSTVRESLGRVLQGESARQLWGVMDVLAVTDFPDIRLKSAIQSAHHGSVLIIPREGGYLVRMYIELDELQGSERASDHRIDPDMLTERARAIMAPYTLEVREVAWWSAYEIGQRVCDAFDDVPDALRPTRTPRIFIAGDACHTHSPKAGQGMNVSMADSFNLGWKLAAVIQGHAHPALLHTYSEERQAKAHELIEFDRDMARLFSAKPANDAEAAQFQRYFSKHGRYTAGVETRYDPCPITDADPHQLLAKGLTVGMRFHSGPVIRLADAKPMQLGHVIKADGRWRLLAFAAQDDTGHVGGGIGALCRFLEQDPTSPLRRYRRAGENIDARIDVRAVFQQGHRALSIEAMPALLLPQKGGLGLIDYEKIFCPDLKTGPNIFDLRGIDKANGAMVLVRPDQYVASVLPLDAYRKLAGFFDAFMLVA